jgi:hypothetical protein
MADTILNSTGSNQVLTIGTSATSANEFCIFWPFLTVYRHV